MQTYQLIGKSLPLLSQFYYYMHDAHKYFVAVAEYIGSDVLGGSNVRYDSMMVGHYALSATIVSPGYLQVWYGNRTGRPKYSRVKNESDVNRSIQI